jgi:S1-C subfamily serine protease
MFYHRIIQYLFLSLALMATSLTPQADMDAAKLIEKTMQSRPSPIVQIVGVSPGNGDAKSSGPINRKRIEEMINEYQEKIPDLVAPSFFLNGVYHSRPFDGDKELLKEIEAELDAIRLQALSDLGFLPSTRYLYVKESKSGSGSGVVIDPRGYVLTAAHVVDKGQKAGSPIWVNINVPKQWLKEEFTLAHGHASQAKNGMGILELEATIVGFERGGDLALLKVYTTRPLPFLPLADKSAPREGQRVAGFAAAFGNARRIQGWSGEVTARTFSSRDGEKAFFVDYLIKPGYSGGPVCNMKGRVIGQSAGLVAIRHPNIADELPGRTSVKYAQSDMAVFKALKQTPMLDGDPKIEWEKGKGYRLDAPLSSSLIDMGLKPGDIITRASTRRCSRYLEKDGKIICEWDKDDGGVYEAKEGKNFLEKALEDAGVGGWILLTLKRDEEQRVLQLRVEGRS